MVTEFSFLGNCAFNTPHAHKSSDDNLWTSVTSAFVEN